MNKELIGRKVKGFWFNDKKHNGLPYSNDDMASFIGEVGLIQYYNSMRDSYHVEFINGETWQYPAELIEQHLVDESETSNIKSIQLNGKDIDLKTKRFAESNPLDNIPIIGEGVLMEVSDNGEVWRQKYVIAKHDGRYIAFNDNNYSVFNTWYYCRPITPKRKITRAEFERQFEIID
jgi:hypothetical protein